MKGMVGKKNSSWTVFIIVSVLLISTVTMYFCFLYYSKNIRATVVKQEINQIELTSNYITKIFHTEMEDCVDVLRENARAYYLSDAENTLEDTVEFLQNIKQHTDFTVVGVIRPDGWSMNDSGIQRRLRDRAVLQAILKNEIYVSDLLISGEKKLGKILIAVPIHENGRAVGAIWGRYPIDVIAKKVEIGNGIFILSMTKGHISAVHPIFPPGMARRQSGMSLASAASLREIPWNQSAAAWKIMSRGLSVFGLRMAAAAMQPSGPWESITGISFLFWRAVLQTDTLERFGNLPYICFLL